MSLSEMNPIVDNLTFFASILYVKPFDASAVVTNFLLKNSTLFWFIWQISRCWGVVIFVEDVYERLVSIVRFSESGFAFVGQSKGN